METRSISDRDKTAKTGRFRRLNAREKTTVVVVVALLLVGLWLPERIIVTTSDSMDHRIYFKIPVEDSRVLASGSYAVFAYQGAAPFIEHGLNRENELMLKKIGCSPGQQLQRDSQGLFSCDGDKLGEALRKDGQGRELPQFNFSGPVPEGKFFVVGDKERSFDSKYIGFIDAEDILYRATPIW
jgi:conjugal transfer pilin signal peptidase TrbI